MVHLGVPRCQIAQSNTPTVYLPSRGYHKSILLTHRKAERRAQAVHETGRCEGHCVVVLAGGRGPQWLMLTRMPSIPRLTSWRMRMGEQTSRSAGGVVYESIHVHIVLPGPFRIVRPAQTIPNSDVKGHGTAHKAG